MRSHPACSARVRKPSGKSGCSRWPASASLTPRNQLKQAEAEALAAADGSDLVNIGFAYSGLGQYDKGIALMQQGIAKGKLKRADEANLHLGIAYLRAGQKAKAQQAFKQVGGTDGTADLARLWMRVA